MITVTISIVLVLAAFLCALASTWTPPRAPLYLAVILLCVAMLLQLLPR